MVNAIAKATIQSALLTLCSALVATFLTPKDPPIVALVLFSILSTPKNYLWQQYLERKLPGYRVEKREAIGEVKGAQSAGGGVTVKRKLNVTNTLTKVGIDQTFGAVTNVALHLLVVSAMQGLPLAECLDVVKTVSLLFDQLDLVLSQLALERTMGRIRSTDWLTGFLQQTWPLMTAGFKVWPLVSLLNFTLVPVEQRTVVGSMVGLGWGVFLALRSAR
ncbi:MAG: hypothetical protein Q9168_005450 [Polycauliona sp. 1 TL-2023]